MERGQMERILHEQGFQNSGVCDASECIVQVGQLLGIDKMVVGSIGQLGSSWVINLRLVDIKSGAIDKQTSYQAESVLSSIRTTLLIPAARSLFGLIPEYTVKPSIETPAPTATPAPKTSIPNDGSSTFFKTHTIGEQDVSIKWKNEWVALGTTPFTTVLPKGELHLVYSNRGGEASKQKEFSIVSNPTISKQVTFADKKFRAGLWLGETAITTLLGLGLGGLNDAMSGMGSGENTGGVGMAIGSGAGFGIGLIIGGTILLASDLGWDYTPSIVNVTKQGVSIRL